MNSISSSDNESEEPLDDKSSDTVVKKGGNQPKPIVDEHKVSKKQSLKESSDSSFG